MEPVTEPAETPEDWEPEECYCIGIERPPCSFCTSPAGDPDREEEPAAPAAIYAPRTPSSATITIRLSITGEQPRVWGWSGAKPRIPLAASVTWTNPQPGSPTRWHVEAVMVTGATLRKNGTQSLNVGTNSIWSGEEREQPWVQAIITAAREELELLLLSCTCTVAADSDGESGYLAEVDDGCPQHGTRAGWEQGHLAWWRLAEVTVGALFPDQTGPFDAPPVEDTLYKLVAKEAVTRIAPAVWNADPVGHTRRGGPIERYNNPATGDRATGDAHLVEQYEHVAGLTYPDQLARLIEHTRKVAARLDQVAEDLSGLSISDQYARELGEIAAALRQGPEA